MKHLFLSLLFVAPPVVSKHYPPAGQKEQAASASAAASAPSTSSSNGKKPATGLDEGKESAASDLLKLVSKDHKEFAIPRELALRYLGLVRTGLENDKEADEFPLPSVSSNVVGQLITAIQTIDERMHDAKFANQVNLVMSMRGVTDNPRSRRAAEITSLGHPLKKFSGLPELIFAANYLDAPLLLDALIEAYTQTPEFNGPAAQLIKDRANKKPGELRGTLLSKVPALESGSKESTKLPLSSKIPIELFPALARSYFLRTGEDIDELLGLKKVYIPVEDIIAHGFIPAHIFEIFPGLEKDLNAIVYNEAKEGDETALSVAAANNNLRAVKGLLRVKGINLNVPTFTPLIQAVLSSTAMYNKAEIVAALLQAGADPNLIDAGGKSKAGRAVRQPAGTALHAAARENDLTSARLLLAAGAKPDIQSALGWTPLMVAAGNGYLDIVKLILQHKPDLSILSDQGLTALAVAAQYQFWDAVLELLKAGADANDLVDVQYLTKTTTDAEYERDLQPIKDVVAYLRQRGKNDVARWLEKKMHEIIVRMETPWE